MLYLPLIVACTIGQEISPADCTYYSAQVFYETEAECTASVTGFLGGVGLNLLAQQNLEITEIHCLLVHEGEVEPEGDPA